MPIKHAAFRALRKSHKNARRNSTVLENIEYLRKKSLKLSAAHDMAQAKEWIAKAIQAIDKAVQHGIMKKNTAARKKSRLMARLHVAKKAK